MISISTAHPGTIRLQQQTYSKSRPIGSKVVIQKIESVHKTLFNQNSSRPNVAQNQVRQFSRQTQPNSRMVMKAEEAELRRKKQKLEEERRKNERREVFYDSVEDAIIIDYAVRNAMRHSSPHSTISTSSDDDNDID